MAGEIYFWQKGVQFCQREDLIKFGKLGLNNLITCVCEGLENNIFILYYIESYFSFVNKLEISLNIKQIKIYNNNLLFI